MFLSFIQRMFFTYQILTIIHDYSRFALFYVILIIALLIHISFSDPFKAGKLNFLGDSHSGEVIVNVGFGGLEKNSIVLQVRLLPLAISPMDNSVLPKLHLDDGRDNSPSLVLISPCLLSSEGSWTCEPVLELSCLILEKLAASWV